MGKNYGSNTLFLLILKKSGQEDLIKPILRNDHKRKVFIKFDFTEESKSNEENFVRFIQNQIDCGNLSYDSFDVIDFGKRVGSIEGEYHEEISIRPLSY